jgi:hypothetical protein
MVPIRMPVHTCAAAVVRRFVERRPGYQRRPRGWGRRKMSDGAIIAITAAALVGIAGSLVWALADAVRTERRGSGVRRLWSNFGLSITFCVLFLVSWLAQAFAEWGTYRDAQAVHQEAATLGGYLVAFGQSTFENWQSEFLQLFSFVVLSAVLIHRGSAESKDGDERIERRLEEISARLDALATERSEATG